METFACTLMEMHSIEKRYMQIKGKNRDSLRLTAKITFNFRYRHEYILDYYKGLQNVRGKSP